MIQKNYILLLLFFYSICSASASAQITDNKLGHLFTIPKSYVVGYTSIPPSLDETPDEGVWKQAVWSDLFVDIEGNLKPAPYYATRVKMLWDSDYLYIAAALQDKHVWAYLDERDQVVFYDNDFEVCIDPSNTTHRYFEYEVNALNTIFDLFLPKPYRAGSGALISWDSKRLKHKVQVHGTLNNPNDEDSGWTVKMAIPFSDVTIGNNTHVPENGEIWRINFSRVQWETEVVDGKYVKKKGADGKDLPEYNWVWSPQGVINMHLPERWGYIQFSKVETGQKLPKFILPYSELQRQYLWLVYYKQQEYRREKGHFAKLLNDLQIESAPVIDGKKNTLSMESTSSQFSAVITDNQSGRIRINEEGYVTD